jgi:alpha-beta hydrolase superfamily lysophospholipase
VSSPQAIYLEGAAEPIFAVLHRPTGSIARDTAVILYPPFGWDEICSYRSRRDWAERLAAVGYPAIRLSLPGTGDSGGSPRDPHRVDAWTGAITATARWLTETLASKRVAAIGIGLGGLLAYRAAAQGAEIDDLVLWATPARGRALVRELSVFAQLEASQFSGPESERPAPIAPGDLTAGGFVLTGETREELSGIDLAALPLPGDRPRRALLLERDGIGVDERLSEYLESCGVAVTVTAGKGYAMMTAEAHLARTPVDVVERVTAWLDEASNTKPLDALPATLSEDRHAEVHTSHSAAVTETPIAFEQPFGQLTGVLTEPHGPRQSDLCLVLLNAGAIRRTGPSRMWVEAARRWAARGIPVLRLDVQGIGDADGEQIDSVEGLYVPELVTQVLAALDSLEELGIGRRYVLAGLCSGAYWSFHSAVEDRRVVAAIMLNPRALIWDPTLLIERKIARGWLRPTNWHKINLASAQRALANLGWAFAALRRLVATRRGRLIHGGDELDLLFDRLRQSGKRVTLLFSDNEPLHEELTRTGHMTRLEQAPHVTLEHIPVRDHTLRPGWAQVQAHEVLDGAIERERQRPEEASSQQVGRERVAGTGRRQD